MDFQTPFGLSWEYCFALFSIIPPFISPFEHGQYTFAEYTGSLKAGQALDEACQLRALV